MLHTKEYSNFVRPNSSQPQLGLYKSNQSVRLNGEEAKRLYLEEIKDAQIKELPLTSFENCTEIQDQVNIYRKSTAHNRNCEINTSNTNLFISAQNNDVRTLKEVLDACPHMINVVDEFGWSLLMIACQANSVEAVKELLNRGIDTSVRDKAGNSARTLVIKNKNLILADILLNTSRFEHKTPQKSQKVKLKEEYVCEICNNKVFPDKQEHISSTEHNINASKNKKIPSNYKIPESNRGFQIMVKVGWDKESGLGKNGCGNKYPVKAIPKLDRKGLGVVKRKSDNLQEKNSNNTINKKKIKNDYYVNRRFEANFRREFY